MDVDIAMTRAFTFFTFYFLLFTFYFLLFTFFVRTLSSLVFLRPFAISARAIQSMSNRDRVTGGAGPCDALAARVDAEAAAGYDREQIESEERYSLIQ
jgi:hypothetical protein